MECSIEMLEQPARKVKFRMEVHSHRCQQKELLLGRKSTDDVVLFPTVKIVPRVGSSRLREGTMVRMSLVDVRSTRDNIIEHWHRLVDCKNDALLAKWAITKRMDSHTGLVTFGNMGIVKTLEKEKVKEVRDRIIARREEQGNCVRNNKWECTQIENYAEQQCKETSTFRLKLCFEAYLPNGQGGIVKVAETAFSDDVVDLTNMNSGELAIKKMSICSDFVEGGAEVMIFTGGDKSENKIGYAKSAFHADFFQINPHNESRVWQHRVTIQDSQLHGVGQHLGGVYFCVPPYDRQANNVATLIEQETENVYMELVKTDKNNTNKIQAKSDPLSFTYRPSDLTRIIRKRPRDPSDLEKFLGPPIKMEVPFVPSFPQDLPMPTFPIGPTHQDIPQTVHPAVTLTQPYDDPYSPASALGNMGINSPQPHFPPSPSPSIQQIYPASPSNQQTYPSSPSNRLYPAPNGSSPGIEDPSSMPVLFDLKAILDGDINILTDDKDLLGCNGDFEKYLQDGRSTVMVDGTVVVDGVVKDKKELLRKLKEKVTQDKILASMNKLSL